MMAYSWQVSTRKHELKERDRMAIMMKLKIPGGTLEQYDRLNEILGINGDEDAPEGLVSHVCGATDDGVLVVDVWDSEESLNAFFENRLGAAMHEVGVPEAQPHIMKVHNMIPKGAGTEPNVIMLVKTDAGPDVYDELVSRLDVHEGNGENHPVYSHVAAVTEDGGMLVVDLWDSPEAFGEFAETQLGPVAEGRLGEIQPRFVPVHNVIRGRATVTA
jgi:heme-degrading monooxygenase HmoA